MFLHTARKYGNNSAYGIFRIGMSGTSDVFSTKYYREHASSRVIGANTSDSSLVAELFILL